MKILLDIIIKFWYLWALIIAAKVLNIFIPKIKGFFGEKFSSLFLSKLDKLKYIVINNIMLQIRNKTIQIDHVIVSIYGNFVIETKNYNG